MKIKNKILFDSAGTFEELLEIWAAFRHFLAKNYAWDTLPEKFELSECTYSEYEEVPFATVHIYSYNYDISFEKDDLKVAINMEDDEITTQYSIDFFKSEQKTHNVSLNTRFKEFTYHTENPFCKELIATIDSISKIEKITPDEISFSKEKGILDERVLWDWLRNNLAVLYPKLIFPEALTFVYNSDEKEHSCKFESNVFKLGISLKKEGEQRLYFFFKQQEHKNSTILLYSTLKYTTLSLSYNHPNKDFWKERFDELRIEN